MIHHISFPANDPEHVASVLAEVMGGKCYPFRPVPGSFMAVSGDKHGTLIEVHSSDVLIVPLRSPIRRSDEWEPQRSAFHVFLSVPIPREKIEAIGQREGWTTRFCTRPSADLLAPGQKPLFCLIEFWVENHFLIEVAPQDLLADYEALYQFDRLDGTASASPA
jgi:hypothetical protein